MAIYRGLCTLQDVRKSVYGKDYLTASTANDADFEDYISAATPVIERITGPLIPQAQTFTFDGGRASLVLPVAFMEVTSVTVDGVAMTDWVPDAAAGIIYGGTSTSPADFTAGVQNVIVVVVTGVISIPSNVVLAARELVRLWWQNGRQGSPDITDLSPGIRKRVTELLEPQRSMPGFA